MLFQFVISIIVFVGLDSVAIASESNPAHSHHVSIPAGDIAPLFGLDRKSGQTSFHVEAFEVDRTPVTQKDFFAFTQKNSSLDFSWARNKISEVYADKKYLQDWKKNGPQKSALNKPVVFVSWFAADAYCAAQGGRLPSTLEWEYIAAANETKANALLDKAFNEQILKWYTSPSANNSIHDVGKSKPNFYGVQDLHGLIWEWTSDFNSFFVTADNRQDGDTTKSLFCGNASTGATNREDYPAFMRYAMRSSLEAVYSLANLGFRCAYDIKK